MQMTLNDPRQPDNWFSADTLLGNKSKVTIAHNTYLERDYINPEVIYARYHATDVVTYYGPNHMDANQVRLNSGGWRTVTTKQRINMLTRLNVWQKDYNWYVTLPIRVIDDYGSRLAYFGQDDETERTLEFEDGMILPNHAVATREY